MRMLIAAALALAATPALAADPVEGDWIVQGGSAKVHIAPCPAKADQLCGVFTWLKNPTNKAGKPVTDPAGKPVMGMTFIRDFKRVGPGRWHGGKIYDPDEGKTYDSKMQIAPDGTLKLSGCVLFICQAQIWKRPAT
jgi:uncharacterized protein (DUF2147 family)